MPSLASITAALGFAVLARAEFQNVEVPSDFFPGPQHGIGSWFTAVSEGTNGKSWCGYKYTDKDPVFAVSLNFMGGKTYAKDRAVWEGATKRYCGLEILAKDPKTGREKLLYLGDAFDPAWVRTPSSIDIMIEAFSELDGNPQGNHDIVIKDVHWQFTGRLNKDFAAPGAIWPTASPSPAVPTTFSTLASTSAAAYPTDINAPPTPVKAPAHAKNPAYGKAPSHANAPAHDKPANGNTPAYGKPANGNTPSYGKPAHGNVPPRGAVPSYGNGTAPVYGNGTIPGHGPVPVPGNTPPTVPGNAPPTVPGYAPPTVPGSAPPKVPSNVHGSRPPYNNGTVPSNGTVPKPGNGTNCTAA